MWRCPAASGRREEPDFAHGCVTYCTAHGARQFNMATAVHDTTLQDITSSTSFQATVAEAPLRSKSCGPDVGRESAGSVAKKDDGASSSTVSVKGNTDTRETGILVSESKSATAISSTKPKIFDNKIFVEAPIPKTNPWLKSTASPVNNNKGENHDNVNVDAIVSR